MPNEFTNLPASRSLCATKYSFSFTSSDKFWTKLIIICQACFHIMTQKMNGLVELSLQWEIYIFTLLFSSTGLLWLSVLWLQFKINEICMNVDFTVTALMFPAIPLLMSVYANRFHTLSTLIRKIHDEYVWEKQYSSRMRKTTY